MKKIKILFVAGLMLFLMIAFGISANAAAPKYEPNGTTSVEYEFDSSECDRTLIVKCYDQDTDAHLKTVNYKTKRGEDTIVITMIYGYRLTKFSSDQGLWETCKLKDGSAYVTHGEIYINYYFRTALSKDTVTVTAYMKKYAPAKFTEKHYKYVPTGNTLSQGYDTNIYSRDFTVSAGDYVSLGGAYTGFSIRSGYSQYISGNFTYKWFDDYHDNFDPPYTDQSWDIIKASCDESKAYTSFDESSDGHFSYCTNLVSCVDFVFNRNKYTVSFNANGGTGSLPASQTQYYEYDMTIGTEAPARGGYTFIGWSTSSTATAASYQPGGTYTMGLNQTLYAVWDKYEFSVSGLTVTLPDKLFPNSTIPVRVRTDNWARCIAYDDIPVELYYDGKLLSTQYIDFSPYGVAYVNFDLNVGSSIGVHTIEVRINRSRKNSETDPDNNSVITTIDVLDGSYDFEITALTGNARYKENTDVMTSYIVYNHSQRDVLPDDEATASFTAYYYDGDIKITITEQLWNGVVLPSKESNLVYFKWSVPNGLADKTVYCQCSINLDGKLNEGNTADNSATLTTVIAKKDSSQTENPSYSANRPSDYVSTSAPTVKNGSASWNMWEYENEEFVLRQYGIKVSDASVLLSPASTCETAVYENGAWTIKSGYGISVSFAPTVEQLSGYAVPDEESFTDIQTVYVTFPEYRYLTEEGSYRVLEYVNGAWSFVENEGAEGNERLHYIPVWFEDGEYTVSVTATDIWTPAGMITAVRNAYVTVDGTVFDDYYVGV